MNQHQHASLRRTGSVELLRANPARTDVVPRHLKGSEGFYPLDDQPSRIDFSLILELVFRRRRQLASLFILAMGLAYLATWLQTPRYRASTLLEISAGPARIIQDLDFAAETNDARTIETARQKLLSHDLANRIVEALQLDEDAGFADSQAFWSSKAAITGAEFDGAVRKKSASSKVRQNLSAEIIRNTRLLSVSFSHEDPSLAASVANQAARSFLDQHIDATSGASRVAQDFIQQQVLLVKRKLETSEKTLVDYARKAGITLTGGDASLISQNIADINASLAKAIDERLTAERHMIQVREDMTASLPQVSASPSVQEAKNRIIELQATYREKSATLKPAFPEMRRLNAQISELRRQLAQEVAGIGRAVEITFQQATEKEASLRAVLLDLEGRQSDFQSKNIEYTILKREVDSNRTQYESLIGKLNDASVAADLRSAAARVLDIAEIPSSPYSPNLAANLGAGFLGFLIVGAAMLWLRELSDQSFSSPAQIETELALPVLGILPRPHGEPSVDEAVADERSSLSEAYRLLRTSLQFTAVDSNRKVLLITSTEPEEGKTITAYKLARDFAALGHNVLVIDADMRHPNMHRMFKLDNGIGLSNLIANVRSGDFRGIFRETDHPLVSFLSAGTIPPNPSDLLASEKMAITLDYCSRQNDIVIVDAPPVVDLADAPILAHLADATLFVVSANQIPRKAAREAAIRLRIAGARIVGVAFTKAEAEGAGYGYARRNAREVHYSVHDDPGLIMARGPHPVAPGVSSSRRMR